KSSRRTVRRPAGGQRLLLARRSFGSLGRTAPGGNTAFSWTPHGTPFFQCAAHGNQPRLATALHICSSPMNTISREEIVEAWTWLCDLDDAETSVLVKKFMDQQPALGIYLFANMEEMEGGAEH